MPDINDWLKERQATPKDTLVNFGSTVKSTDDKGVIGGHVVLYGSPNEVDFYNEYFGPDTDFDRLAVTGSASLGGTLDIDANVIPSPAVTFLTAGSISGDWDEIVNIPDNWVTVGATSASVLASSISLGRLSMRRSLSPRATNSRRRRMIWPARRAWSAGVATLPMISINNRGRIVVAEISVRRVRSVPTATAPRPAYRRAIDKSPLVNDSRNQDCPRGKGSPGRRCVRMIARVGGGSQMGLNPSAGGGPL